jgi:hypothetical protein
MNLPTTTTFAPIFVQGCQAKAKAQLPDLVINDAGRSELVVCGYGDGAFVLSSVGLRFRDTDGTVATYSWQELDFILPSDLSLARDKLDTFKDVEVLAARAARVIGKIGAYLAAGLLALLVLYVAYSVLISPVIWFHENWGVFGDIVGIIYFLGACALLAPVGIPIAIGALAAGGIAAVIGNFLGRMTQPLVHLVLAHLAGDFHNGILVIRSRWVKLPWGTSTTQLHDFIMLGVKLRRRGLL